MPRSQAQVTHQDAVLEGCRAASNVRAFVQPGSPGWRVLVNRPTADARLLGASRDDQLAATNESKLAGGEQGLRDQRDAVKSTRGGT